MKITQANSLSLGSDAIVGKLDSAAVASLSQRAKRRALIGGGIITTLPVTRHVQKTMSAKAALPRPTDK